MLYILFKISFIISTILTLIIFIYPPILDYVSSNKKLKKKENIEPYPDVTIVIPTYMEEENIQKKIENTKNYNYPNDKMEIIVIDGGSNDNTVKISKKIEGIKVINLNQRGKIRAINNGIKNAKSDLVLMTDADVLIEPNALKETIHYLNQNVAAISSKGTISNSNNFYSHSKKRYHNKDFNMRHKESLLDNCCSLDGKFILLDKNKINHIDESGYTDDFTLTLQAYKKGYKSIVINKNFFHENAKSTLTEEIKQMKRRCKTSIADSFKNADVILNNKSWYSLFIFPFRRLLNFFTPFFLLIIGLYTLLFIPSMFTILVVLYILFTFRNSYYSVLMISLFLAWFDVVTINLNKGAFWNS